MAHATEPVRVGSDDQGGPLDPTPEERQARAEAFRQWMIRDAATPDDTPPEVARAIGLALGYFSRDPEPRRGAQHWLRDFFSMRGRLGWPARTRRNRR